jgi:hypothetical protein
VQVPANLRSILHAAAQLLFPCGVICSNMLAPVPSLVIPVFTCYAVLFTAYNTFEPVLPLHLQVTMPRAGCSLDEPFAGRNGWGGGVLLVYITRCSVPIAIPSCMPNGIILLYRRFNHDVIVSILHVPHWYSLLVLLCGQRGGHSGG